MARSSTVLAFAVSAFILTVLADPARDVEARAGSVCDGGIYGELAPILSAYPVAQAFCTSAYPPKCNTAIAKRAPPSVTTKSTPTTTSMSKSSSGSSSITAKSTTSSKPFGAKSAAWSKLAAQAGNVVSTLCSCIQVPLKACQTTARTTTTSKSSVTTTKSTALSTTGSGSSSSSSTTTTKNTTPSTTSTSPGSTATSSSLLTSSTTSTTVVSSSTTTSSTTSATSPAHTIDAPRCDAATANGIENGGCSDQCTCEPDVEGVYYCGSASDNVSCDANDQCPQGEYCAGNSVSCSTGNVPGDECTSSFNPGMKRRSRSDRIAMFI